MQSANLRWGRWLAAAALVYTAYAAAYTWPLPLHWHDHLRAAPLWGAIDLDLHLWTLAWVSRAVVTAPLRVFDANVFHPARLTLAGSDHMLGALPVAAPVYWATGNPVATLNAVVLSSFPLAGLAAFALVAASTGSGWAGLLGGFVYAFAPWRTHSFVPVQTFSIQYLPLALLALTVYLRRGGRVVLAGGLVALALQLLVAYYVAYAALVTLAVWLAAVARTDRPPRERWVALAAGLAVVFAVVAAASWPYLLRRDVGAIHAYGGALGLAMLPDWLGPGLFRRDQHVYLGFVPRGLAAIACVPPWRAGRWLAVALAGWVLCLGSHAVVGGVRIPLPYAWLAAVIPGFASMRIALRFFTVVTLGVGGLAALGLERVRRASRPAVGTALAAALVAAVLWEYRPLEWPMPLRRVPVGDAVPEAYRWLAAHGGGRPLLELPVGRADSLTATRRQSRAMYFSTVHWLPLLNGYTAYPPPSHALLSRVARQLPEPEGLETLVNLVDVGWILVHLDAVPPAERDAWTALPGLRLAARFGPDAVFEVTRPPSADWRRALLDPPAGQTIGVVPTAPLPPAARAARIEEVELPARFVFGRGREGVVRIVNEGDATWPALAMESDGVVALALEWDGPKKKTEVVGLPRDLPPAGSVVLRFALRPPGAGHYRLTVALRQGKERFPAETAPPLVRPLDVASR